MKIHNQLEQLVIEAVDQIYDSLPQDSETGPCRCEQCRLDVACYALNRLPPKYIISERGFSHLESDQTLQETADLIALVKDGIDRVSRVRRPHAPLDSEDKRISHDGPWRNFPVITGVVLDGRTFEPVSGVSVELQIAGIPAKMESTRWQNPLVLPEQAQGRFSFWPAPVPVTAHAAPAVLDCDLHVQSDVYENLHHFFQLTIDTSDREISTPQTTHDVDNLHLFGAI